MKTLSLLTYVLSGNQIGWDLCAKMIEKNISICSFSFLLFRLFPLSFSWLFSLSFFCSLSFLVSFLVSFFLVSPFISCCSFKFFSHLLSPQLLRTHFFRFLANFYLDVGLYHWIFFVKMACTMQMLAKIMENLSFFAVLSIFLTLAVATASWDPFFRIPCKFLRGYRSFSLNFLHESGLYQCKLEQKRLKKVTTTTRGEKIDFFQKAPSEWFSTAWILFYIAKEIWKTQRKNE